MVGKRAEGLAIMSKSSFLTFFSGKENKTEVIEDNLDPEWTDKVRLDFFYYCKQHYADPRYWYKWLYIDR